MDPDKSKEILKILYTQSKPYHDLIAKSEDSGFTYDDFLAGIIGKCMPEYGETIRLLDVASGTGHYLKAARESGAFSCGVDLSLYACRMARERDLSVFQADAECLPFKNDAFDVVVCLQLLEHTIYPEKVIAEISRVLRPGGSLFLSAPNMLGSNRLSRSLRGIKWFFSGRVKDLKTLPEGIVEEWERAVEPSSVNDMDACNRSNVFQAFNLLRMNDLRVEHVDTLRHPLKYSPWQYAWAKAGQRIPLIKYTGINFKIIARKR